MDDTDLQIPRKNATLRYMVEEKLRKAIATGRFKPGERLIERELCELIGVGRTSVREALRQLEAEGLIRSYPHRGPVVSTISLAEAEQLYKIRGLLEGFCGAEFARNGTEAQIATLEAAVADFAQAATAGNRERLIDTKTAVYACLMKGAGNTFVEQMLTSLHNRVTLLRVISMTQEGRLPESVAEIREILAAIRARDSDRAQAACIRHIEEAARIALACLRVQPAPAAV